MKLYRYTPHTRKGCDWWGSIELSSTLITRTMIRDAYRRIREGGTNRAVTRHAVVDLLETHICWRPSTWWEAHYD